MDTWESASNPPKESGFYFVINAIGQISIEFYNGSSCRWEGVREKNKPVGYNIKKITKE